MSFTPIHLDRSLLEDGVTASEALKIQSRKLSNESVDKARAVVSKITTGDNYEYAEAEFHSCLRHIIDLLTENLAMMAIAISEKPEECHPQDTLWCTVVASVRESTLEYMELLADSPTSMSTCMIAADYVDAMADWEAGIEEDEGGDFDA